MKNKNIKRLLVRSTNLQLDKLYIAINQFSGKEEPIIIREDVYNYHSTSIMYYIDQNNNNYYYQRNGSFWSSEKCVNNKNIKYPHSLLYTATKIDLRKYWPIFIADNTNE